ncbi:hypothetical protein DSCW_11620 [Desulfosarcina widdelii]|uniref:Methyltransferase type 11 domain-containing protein n=1 Tax=Desulfosarcina widdelii TaxID=947919 RepID=A0A5K7YZ83_9BACT|nr:hypothetical protein DSCW_11620 [Desulfosarcina widdelii]
MACLAACAVGLYGCHVDFSVCDLKCYQDLLVYGFVIENVSPGSRVLEIGGGDSRVLGSLTAEYECWNIDKYEGLGNGPVKASDEKGNRLVKDYIGNFNPMLKEQYFDFVFSISVLEHIREDRGITFADILMDMERVMAPGALSLHCLDLVIKNEFVWSSPILKFLFEKSVTLNRFVPFQELLADGNIYMMTEEAYDSCWRDITQKEYAAFGKPFSYNILMQKMR